MTLTKSLFLSVHCSDAIMNIVNDHINDSPEEIASHLKQYENDVIDNIVCDLMYRRDANKGPKFVEKVVHKVADVAAARLISINAQQSKKVPFVTDNTVVYECDAIEIVKCFKPLPVFQSKMTEIILESLDVSGKSIYSSLTVDDILIILHSTLIDHLNDTDYYTSCMDIITASVNMVELAKVEENVDNAVRWLAAKCTYICAINAIENTKLFNNQSDKATS